MPSSSGTNRISAYNMEDNEKVINIFIKTALLVHAVCAHIEKLKMHAAPKIRLAWLRLIVRT
jgi:hypothetical protein